MSDREMLDDVTCPSCGSPLVSLDLDASDDHVGRMRHSRANGSVAMFGGLGLLLTLCTIAYVIVVWRNGIPFSDWGNTLARGGITALVLGFLIRLALREWWWSRTSRAQRLVTCHACGHAWRLPDVD